MASVAAIRNRLADHMGPISEGERRAVNEACAKGCRGCDHIHRLCLARDHYVCMVVGRQVPLVMVPKGG
jgi:hypothetical protein